MKHLVITGHKNSGKTTFLEQVLKDYKGEIRGFATRIMGVKSNGFREIYLLRAVDVYGKDAILKPQEYGRFNVKKDLQTGEVFYPADILKKFNLSKKNHMSDCNMKEHIVFTDVFEDYGVDYLAAAYWEAAKNPDNTIIVMDELGFMESDAHEFQKWVLRILDSDFKVIATLRRKGSTEFMEKIRNHDKVDLVEITLDNRDELIEKYKDITSL